MNSTKLCLTCQHDNYDHGRWEWLRVDGKFDLVKVSDHCTKEILQRDGSTIICNCERYISKPETIGFTPALIAELSARERNGK